MEFLKMQSVIASNPIHFLSKMLYLSINESHLGKVLVNIVIHTL